MTDERWHGQTDARIQDAERRLDALNDNMARVWQSLDRLNVAVARIGTRVAVESGVAAFVGASAVAVAVALLR